LDGRRRANEAVVALLAATLAIKGRQVTVTRGASARRKTIEIDGLDPAEVRRRLDAALAVKTERRRTETR
jgi:uncharacterized protein YggU (UPF0235/DUF167 family)